MLLGTGKPPPDENGPGSLSFRFNSNWDSTEFMTWYALMIFVFDWIFLHSFGMLREKQVPGMCIYIHMYLYIYIFHCLHAVLQYKVNFDSEESDVR